MARDEAANLHQLVASLDAQTAPPTQWVVVDNGSTDDTATVIEELSRDRAWIRPEFVSRGAGVTRAEPIVRGLERALLAIDERVDVVMKIDADVSFGSDYCRRLLREFEHDPKLGIASGTAYEEGANGLWRQRHGTGPAVWGACRAYRWESLQDVLPFEERLGWDTIDLVRASMRGWRTRVLLDLPFLHHRAEGVREGGAWRRWATEGQAAHYMGYRLSYLLLRTAFRASGDRSSLGLLAGYFGAAMRRERRCDAELRRFLRNEQRARKVPVRIREALRRRRVLDAAP